MPRTRSLAFSELKIGILAITALVLASVMIFAVGGAGGFFWQQYHLKTRFDNVQGLKPGAVVRVAGMEVGSVDSVDFVGAEIEVTMSVSKDMRPRITTESVARLGSLSLLGESAVDISAATTGTPVPEWGYVKSRPAAKALAEVAETANVGLEEATRLLQDIRSGKGTMGRLFTDEALYREMEALVGAAGDVTRALNRGEGTIGGLLKDRSAYRQLDASMRNLNEITRRINAGEGSLGRFLKDEELARSLTATTQNIDRISGRLEKGEGTAGRLLTDKTLFDRLNSFSARLDQLVGALNAGEGTAGQVLRNKQLYENMNATVTELRGLVSEIRKDPKKYLNVKVSIF